MRLIILGGGEGAGCAGAGRLASSAALVNMPLEMGLERSASSMPSDMNEGSKVGAWRMRMAGISSPSLWPAFSARARRAHSETKVLTVCASKTQ